MLNKTALITGASTGIGYELTKIFAKNGYNLALVSRTSEKLEAIAGKMESQNDITAKVFAKDLSIASAPQELYDATISESIEIDVLVNNAGFGLNGNFAASFIMGVYFFNHLLRNFSCWREDPYSEIF